MAIRSNILKRFWQELKRRKVFKVVAMYAGTAYVIIQVVEMLAEPLHLPPWITTLFVVILSAGFPATAILAWIFDLTPEGIMKTESFEESKSKETVVRPIRRNLKISDFVIVVLLVIVVILAWPKIFKRNNLENLRTSDGKISVAVMPFQNMTSDSSWNIWQSGIQNELIASLTNSEELKVRQIETVNSLLQSKGLINYGSIKPSDASAVSQKLDANVFIYGNINQADSIIRLNAQLINSKTGDAFKSFQVDGTPDNILYSIDSLSVMVKNFLIISRLVKNLPVYEQHHPSTNSPEAYRYYLYGDNARRKRDYNEAIRMFKEALAIDSNFTVATLALSVTYVNRGLYEEGRKWSDRAYKKRDQMSIHLKNVADRNHASFYETPIEEIKYLNQYLEIDDRFPGTYYDLGCQYSYLYQYDKAIPEFEKSLELYHNWGTKPWWVYNYGMLGEAYHKTGQYKKEKKLYRKADKDFPNEPLITWRKIILSLSEGDTITANVNIKQYTAIYKDNSWSMAALERNLGWAYNDAKMLDKAEESFRNAMKLEPKNPWWIYYVAWFLIDKDRNIDEGLELIDKVLESNPDNFYYLFIATKGWGLYKKSQYGEALELLEKSWKSKLSYDHEIYLHLEAAKKAVANQKTN